MDIERLLNQHKDALYKQMIRVCNGNHDDAQDALAEAFISAIRFSDGLRDSNAFRAWLTKIGTRVCMKMRSRDQILEALSIHGLSEESLEPATSAEGPQDQIFWSQMKACISQAVNALPIIYREVYISCELEQKSIKETALALGISVPTLKSRLHRARQKVRQALDDSLCTNYLGRVAGGRDERI